MINDGQRLRWGMPGTKRVLVRACVRVCVCVCALVSPRVLIRVSLMRLGNSRVLLTHTHTRVGPMLVSYFTS